MATLESSETKEAVNNRYTFYHCVSIGTDRAVPIIQGHIYYRESNIAILPFTATYSGYRPNSNFPPQKTRHSGKNIKYFTLFLKHPAKKMVFLLGHSKHSHGCGEWGRGLEAEQKKGWIVEHIHHV
jgi:hypothetical protein